MNRVKKLNGKVWIAGMENLQFDGEKNSVINTCTIVLQCHGEDTSYDYLMGLSSLAFRLQVHDVWCPSSPHAHCGWSCDKQLWQALNYIPKDYSCDLKDSDKVRAIKAIIAESIDNGIPVIHVDIENSLIVGYENNGQTLLGRDYFDDDKEPGFYPFEKWEWEFCIIEKTQKSINESESIIKSLKTAIMLARYEQKFEEAYASGFNAYQMWIDDLRNESKMAKIKKEHLSWNAHIYTSLIDARSCAGKYLTKIAGSFSDPAKKHLNNAADLYEKIVQVLTSASKSIKWTWQVRTVQEWTNEMKEDQAKALQEAMEIEKDAIEAIESAVG